MLCEQNYPTPSSHRSVPTYSGVGLLSVAQQVLTDFGWEDLQSAMYAAEEVDQAIVKELEIAHAAYMEEPEAGQRQHLERRSITLLINFRRIMQESII